MKTSLNTFLVISVGAALLQLGCAQQKPVDAKPAPPVGAKPAATTAGKQVASTNLQDRAGYAIGVSIGNNLKRGRFDVNLDELMKGIKDVLAGRESLLNEQQAREAIVTYQQWKQQELLSKNLKEGETFLAENKSHPGIQTHLVTLSDGKTAELQYKVVTEGTGAVPQSNDTVTVNYRGMLVNGQEFDSSYKRAHPAKFIVNRVIRGWTEALQMMKVGSHWVLYVPSDLAYGERPPMPGIEPGDTLIFDVELVATESPEPPKPVTSDIIRVPSADEMKAGARIEVIKAEDAQKTAAGQTNQTTNTNTNN
jgi:FKBP-type peptidyl-prolyl cis-trans isomerase